MISCIARSVLWRKPRAAFDPNRVYEIGYTHNPPYQIHRPGKVPRGFAVAIIADPVPKAAHLDSVRLKQVLLNRVGNSMKFTQCGAVNVHLSYIDGEAPELLFQVTDTGIGMEDAKQSQMFEPFVQGDDSTGRRFGGSGLGLAISRQLVVMMGGRICFESAAGDGSVFSFTVPMKEPKKHLCCGYRNHLCAGSTIRFTVPGIY